ncbi:MAG: hypothetical protein PHS86_12980 [Syntrophaceae bacterium]|nr:hypothetical protein [Syntrophaceae bacterium]
MKKEMFFLLFIFVASAFWETVSRAQDAGCCETIVVLGESPVYEGNVAQGKERALQEAFSAAITQVMGTYITAESFSQNFVSIDRSVLSKTRGYIRTYDILEVRQQLDDVSLKVKIVVSKESIKDDLTALGILLDAMENPVVEMHGRDEGLDAPESVSVIKEVLVGKGFYIVDQNQSRLPDVIIGLTGKITNQSTFANTGLCGAIVTLGAKAAQQSTQKVIASTDVSANGAGLNETAALKEAYRKAAEELAHQLIEAISEKWGEELTAGRPLQLIVKAHEYAKVQKFTGELGRIFGIKKVDLKSFQNNEAYYLVRFTGQTKTLVDFILKRSVDGLSVSVQQFDAALVYLCLN